MRTVPYELALVDGSNEVNGGECENVSSNILSSLLRHSVLSDDVQDVDIPIHLEEVEAALFIVKLLILR